MRKYDFSGWATKNDLKCTDGRIIRSGAFRANDGQTVPIVWNHQHNDVDDVLGHAILENRKEGVYAYCSLNNTPKGQHAKECIAHGDITSLSIWANELQQNGPEVTHGVIREVSLVLAGANPGAFIESVMAHGLPMDDYDEEGLFYTGEGLYLAHAIDDSKEKKEDESQETSEDTKKFDSSQEEQKGDNTMPKEKTVQDVIDSMTEEQKNVMYAMVAQALADKGGSSDNDEEDDEMKHNVFSDGQPETQYLSHSDMAQIFADAKKMGSLREAVEENLDGGILAHSIDTTGMDTATGRQTYGFNDPSMLFPEFRNLNKTPEWLSRDMDWVAKVMAAVHRTPFSRIKSMYADITEDAARAKGYIKGKQKKDEVFTTLKRTTTPQTIYKKQKLDRDDMVDITDFDVVAWIRGEMRVMLNEEIARAILIGDGRPGADEDKISEEHVRPIVTDVPLFNTTVFVEVEQDATPEQIANATIDAIIRSKKDYKGSGNPTFWTTEDTLTEMLMLKDQIGHRMYKTEGEIATALRVKDVITVEPMENHQVEKAGVKYPLIGVMVNLTDYNVGADKGGEINMFDDFDIDYNQQKYLIETRISGALIKPYSAVTFLLKKKQE